MAKCLRCQKKGSYLDGLCGECYADTNEGDRKLQQGRISRLEQALRAIRDHRGTQREDDKGEAYRECAAIAAEALKGEK